MRLNLNKAVIESIEPPEKGQRVEIKDARTPGLILRVTDKGTRTFSLYRRVRGVPKRIKLGTWPAMTVEQARRRAIEYLSEIGSGGDPVERRKREQLQREAERARSVTLLEAFELYLEARSLKPKTIKNYREAFQATYRDWKSLSLQSITEDMVRIRHRERGKVSPAGADSAARVLRAVFNYAARRLKDESGERLLLVNPVDALSVDGCWNNPPRRETLIKPYQLAAWWAAVENLRGERVTSGASVARDLLKFLLLTGLRLNEGARLEWSRVDLVGASFEVVDTKNGKRLELPLSDYLVELLRAREKLNEADASHFVFPGPSGHFKALRRWAAIVAAESGVQFTPHDLRRTFITTADALDISAYSIKRLVNHKSNKDDVTEGYVVRSVERLRVAMQRITDELLRQADATGHERHTSESDHAQPEEEAQ